MSKGFFSTFLRVASIGVQFIPGFGQLAAIVRAGIVIGLNVGATLVAPKGRQQARQAATTTLQLGEVPRRTRLRRLP